MTQPSRRRQRKLEALPQLKREPAPRTRADSTRAGRSAPVDDQGEPSVRKVHVKGKGQPAAQVFKRKTLEGNLSVEADGRVVALTSLNKVYWDEKGYTKGDLIRYYFSIADIVLPYLQDRPLILKRFPNGIEGKSFFQHDVDEVPDYVETFTTQALGHTVDYVVCNNTATLLYLVNLGMIPLHPWHSQTTHPDHPDWFVFDLDPGKVEFKIVRRAALAVKDFLDRLGLVSYCKTSGSRGLHVYVPIQPQYTYEEIAPFAERIAKLIVQEDPDTTTLVRSLDRRKTDQIYLDHLQNARGKTIVAPYSVRERAAASVSAPLEWKELKGDITPGDFTIETMGKRLKRKGDVFAEALTNKQTLENAFVRLSELETSRPRKK